MANPIVENIAKTNADALAKSGQVAEAIMKGSTTAPTESGSEHGSGQLGYVAAIADSGFDTGLDQLLLQFDELSRAFHGEKFLNRGSQILGVFSRQFLIRLGQLLNTCSRGVAAFGQSGCTAIHDRLCDLPTLG